MYISVINSLQLSFCISIHPTQVQIMKINANFASLLNAIRNQVIKSLLNLLPTCSLEEISEIMYWKETNLSKLFLCRLKRLSGILGKLILILHNFTSSI